MSSALSQLQKLRLTDFRGGPVVGKPPANAGDTDLIPDPERVHMLEGRQSPCTTTTEPAVKGSSLSPQLEKALCSNEDPE